MRQKLLYLLFLLTSCLINAHDKSENFFNAPTHAHIYTGGASNNAYHIPNFTLNNFSTCQTSVSLVANGDNWAGYTEVRYAIEVNGQTIMSNLNGQVNVDLTPYIPVTSVKLRSDNYSGYWLAMSATVTVNSPIASMPTTVPTVTNAVMCFSALPYTLQASLTSGGSTLKWYTNEMGGNASLDPLVVNTYGNHTYWVSQADSNGCEGIRVPLTVVVQPQIAATATIANSSCLVANGSITLNPNGGFSPYTYYWSDGAVTKDRTNILWGDYSVIITDSNNCSSAPINFTVGMYTDMVVTELSKTDVFCNGQADGALTIEVSGGAGNYTYEWSPNVAVGVGTSSVSQLSAGNYTVKITDANNCVTEQSFTIEESAPIQVYPAGGSNFCNPSTENYAIVEVYGGLEPYTYSWFPYGGTAATATNLSEGIYTVTVTDSNGCEGQTEIFIDSFDLDITITSSQTNVSCPGAADGTATVLLQNESSEFENYYYYSWFPTGGNEATATGLAAGDYVVQIYNMMYDCEIQQSFTITQLSANSSVVTELVTAEATNGAIEVTVTDGTAPYTYLWSNAETTASISNLTAGTYSCTITDANGCTVVDQIELIYVAPLTPTAFELTGGGAVCTNNTSVAIGLDNSEEGVSYQLQLDATNVGTPVTGTGEAITFGTFDEAGTYTVLGTNTETEVSTAMTGEATISTANYVVTMAQPIIPCIPGIPAQLSGVVESVETVEGFTGDYAPQNWLLTNNEANGNVSTINVPESITIVGGDGGSGSGTTDFTITIPSTGNLSFNWSYSTNDGAWYDYPQVVYNGVPTVFSGYNTGGTDSQSGTMTVNVEAGATFAFRMFTSDNIGGPATVVISNLQAPQLVSAEVDVLWTTTDGVINGATGQLEASVSASGTYTLTATVGDCSFSQSVVVDFENPVLIETTWDGTAWSNGEPFFGHKAIIDGDLVLTQQLLACELEITANGSLTVQANADVGIVGKITNNATATDFVVENDGRVLQLNSVANEGPATVKRNSSNLWRQDYTLWSSPVSAQNLRAFSPQTLYNRFNSYDTALGINGDYVQEIVNTEDMNTKLFDLAKGYLIRMPNNWVINGEGPAAPYQGTFTGTLHNGDLNFVLSEANTKFNLVGNPYASPISIAEFWSINSANIESTLYFYRKTNGNPGSGYIAHNLMGGSEPGLPIANIQTGQGFFVTAKTNTLVFNNSMRTNTGTTNFYKSATSSLEAHRFWLTLAKENNIVGQTLVGYATGATLNVDNGFDSAYFNDSPLALTSMIGTNEFSIQGRSLPFVDTDVVPLGFKTDVAGSFTISLASFDGLFAENQDIFLKDNATNNVQNLKAGDYTFVTQIGTFNERFEVTYNSTLGTSNPVLDVNTILIGVKNQKIKINAGMIEMSRIELVDVSGRIIYTLKDVNATTATIEKLVTSNQMLIVKIHTSENKVINKKIIF